jgi:hypothetical protein
MRKITHKRSAIYTHHENFLYLLGELELLIASDAVEWSPSSAMTARHRLGVLSSAMHRIAAQFENQ